MEQAGGDAVVDDGSDGDDPPPLEIGQHLGQGAVADGDGPGVDPDRPTRAGPVGEYQSRAASRRKAGEPGAPTMESKVDKSWAEACTRASDSRFSLVPKW
ncbi:hypothetical protein GCM10018954_091400 [Kutzneria kofuensis]